MIAHAIRSQSLLQIPRPRFNSAYRAFIRSQPCCVCETLYSVECSHTGPRGLGTKASDLDGIPLCRRHHRTGKLSYHTLGRRRFESFHSISIPQMIQKLNALAEAAGVKL